MIDYHIHTSISGDCGVSMKNMADAAHAKGLREICFTEHIDLDFPCDIDFTVDFKAYNDQFEAVQKEYPEINMRQGIEAGLDLHVKDRVKDLISEQTLDFVIGSQHIVFGHDPFYKDVWGQFTQQQVYEEYLRESIASVKACDFFDVLGHLGYISKFCPYDDKLMRYADFSDAIDTILQILIDKGKGLEINTNGLHMMPDTMPEMPIAKRFFELGGEIITVGSDAHYDCVVGFAVGESLAKLKDIGFQFVCAFDQRKPRFIPIP